MSAAVLAVVAIVLCILFRILNVNSQPQKPSIFCRDIKFLETLMKAAPCLEDPYVPPRLWGFSGHLQTILHSIIGRVKCPWPIGERCFLHLDDGTTLTYDLYEPLTKHSLETEVTLAICPGICNTSESVYIRTFVHYAQCHGYRCAVLNHVGALSSVPVTAPRIFQYGHTGDFRAMLSHLLARCPSTAVIAVGFSLGGNIVTKYLGEVGESRPSRVIGGISICQGYDALIGTKLLMNWQNFRRFYQYVMTESIKSLIMKHRSVLLTDDVKRKFGVNEREIVTAATLPELDEAYTRRLFRYSSVSELYSKSSCIHSMHNIKGAVVFINALDDPIIPEPLLEIAKNFSRTHDSSVYVEVSHGGHLGFYEGGFIYPNPVTWLDRSVVALADGLLMHHGSDVKVQ